MYEVKKPVAKKSVAKKLVAKKGGEHFLKRFMLTDDKINNLKKRIKNPFNIDKKTGRLTTKKSPPTDAELMDSIIKNDMAYRNKEFANNHLKLMGRNI